MSPGFGLRPGVRRLFRLPVRGRAARKAEMDQELEAVIEARADALIAAGVAPSDARAAAMRALGVPLEALRVQLHMSVEDQARRMELRDYLADATQDARYALRGLLRTPGFTAVILATLAISIGATTAIFSAVDALLLRPLPFAHPEQLMQLDLVAPEIGRLTGSDAMPWSYPKFAEFRSRQAVFSDLAVHEDMQFAVTAPHVELIRGESVGSSYLRTLGVRIVVGRDMDPSFDAHPEASREVVLGYSLWQSRYGGDPGVLGRTIEIDETPFTIVGVAEPGFRGLSGKADMFGPLTARRGAGLKGAHSYVFSVLARRKPSVTVEQAAKATETLGAQINREFVKAGRADSAWTARAVPLNGMRVSPLVRRSVLVLFGAVSLVLLIACTNVANLLLGRAARRRPEISVRLAIGANRGRLVRLMLTESVVLAVAGGACGLVVAWLGTRALSAIDPSTALGRSRGNGFGAISFDSIHMDWRALAFIAAVSLLIGIVFGLVPAMTVRRIEVADALRGCSMEKRRGGVVGLGGRRALVVAEVALSMVLLAGSGLMLRSLAKLLTTDYGFDGSHVLAFRVTSLPSGPVTDVFQGFWAGVSRELRGLPGVTAVGLGSHGPLEGGSATSTIKSLDGVAVDPDRSPLVGVGEANADWFAALRVPLRQGRIFGQGDVQTAPHVVLVNETAGRMLFPGQSPLGHQVAAAGGMEGSATIVGVVGDVRQFPDSAPAPELFLPLSQMGEQRLEVFIRTKQDAVSLAASVRRTLRDYDASAVLSDMQTMSERTRGATARARFGALLIGLFAATALALALIGVYGVMSLAISARTREIGVRIALGADASRVRRLIVGDAMALVLIGGSLGIAGAMLSTRVLRSLLFDLSTTDPVTYATITMLLFATALGAAWLPARRAARIDPMQALRAE